MTLEGAGQDIAAECKENVDRRIAVILKIQRRQVNIARDTSVCRQRYHKVRREGPEKMQQQNLQGCEAPDRFEIGDTRYLVATAFGILARRATHRSGVGDAVARPTPGD